MILMVAIVGLFCAASSAQINDDTVKLDNLEQMPLSRPIAEYALAGGSLVAALAIGFFPSKRPTGRETAPR
jgi:hypothetical protein